MIDAETDSNALRTLAVGLEADRDHLLGRVRTLTNELNETKHGVSMHGVAGRGLAQEGGGEGPDPASRTPHADGSGATAGSGAGGAGGPGGESRPSGTSGTSGTSEMALLQARAEVESLTASQRMLVNRATVAEASVVQLSKELKTHGVAISALKLEKEQLQVLKGV